jgi:hypothetical protein
MTIDHTKVMKNPGGGVTDIETYPTRQANRPMLEEMSRITTMLRRDGKMSQLYPVLLF